MRRFTDVNYYEVLGVSSDTTRDSIKSAYRALARTAHPDTGGDPDQFALISEAWEVLGDIGQREHYDADYRMKLRASRPYTRVRHERCEPAPDDSSFTSSRLDGRFATASATATATTRTASDYGSGDGSTVAETWMRNKRRL